MKFTTRVILLVLGSIFISITLIAFLLYHDVKKAMGTEFTRTAQSISERLVKEISYPIYIGNMKSARQIIAQYMKFTSLQGVTIKNTRGETILSMGKARGHRIIKPINFKEETTTPYLMGESRGSYRIKELGTAILYFSYREIERVEKQIFEKTVIITFILFILLGTLSYVLTDSLLKPITQLRKSMEESEMIGEPSKITYPLKRRDEIGELINSYNRMIDALLDARKQLEDTYRELARKDKLAYLGKIITMVAHELKNPLGIIKSSAQLLLSHPEQRELITFIIEETERLDNVIKEFLLFANTREPAMEELDLEDTIQRAILIWESTHNDAPPVSIRCNDKLKIKADRTLLTHVLVNLLNNSLDAAHPERELNITIRCFEENGTVILEIEDNGIGIREADLGKIFEPFFTTRDSGTGMGLSIAYDIIKKHGGTINVTSQIDRGTKFTIRLPGNRHEKDSDS